MAVVAPAAGAVQTPQAKIVSADPADWTPSVMDGQVNAVAQVGNRIIVGGTFTTVRLAGSSTDIPRRGLFSFDAVTGAIDNAFNPSPDDDVEALEPGPEGNTIIVGGAFRTIAGVKHKGIAKLNVSNGSLVSAFTTTTDARVYDLALRGTRLYLAGVFAKVNNAARSRLARVDATTGALDAGLNITFSGVHNGGTTVLSKMDVTPDGSRLVGIGNFTNVGGLTRDQFVVIDTAGATASVSTYYTSRFSVACSSSFPTYMRDVDISPDGSYFAIVTTGAYRAGSLCDATSRFDWTAPGTDKQPTWVDYTGGDTLYSVAITGTAIYVGGHNRWVNNPFRGDAPGPGAVPREGIAALDPANGLPFSWNPGRTRGVGVFALVATSTGLWVGSDTDELGGEYHPRLGFFPLDGGVTPPPVRPITLPDDLYRAVPTTTSSGSGGTVLTRVNAGGDQLAALDGGPVWAADTDAAPSPLHNSGSNTATWTPVSAVTAAVPPTTPSQVFDSERWDPADATEMAWHIPVSAGTKINVRLYFANRYSGTSQPGQRVFDVAIDGTTVLDHYDIVADAGDQIGTMKSFPITSDGTVDITFTHEVENPLIDAIEIVTQTAPPPSSPDSGNLVRRSFDGTAAGASAAVSGPAVDGIDWSHARGAFMLDGTLYTGWDDGHLYARTYNGSTFGPPRDINLYGLTSSQFPIAALTGMTLTPGNMLFTVAGDTRLYSRYFTYESEIVGADKFVVSGNGDGFDWSTANGLAVVGSTLYYGSSADGNLRRVTLNGLVPQPGTVQPVSGPSIDGIDWRTRALFFGQQAQVVNTPPTASFTSSCTGLGCTFDGTGSTDGDGTVTGWSWDFGDGTTGTGSTSSHTYAAPGTYTVTLRVTDNGGATGQVANPVTVVNPSTSAIAFRASTSVNVSSTSWNVTVPSSVQAGDALILVVTSNSETSNPVAPAGWTTVGTVVDDTMLSRVFERVATAGDAGSNVRIDQSGAYKMSIALLAYSGTSTSDPIAAAASAVEPAVSATHVTPVVNNTTTGAWLVSYWADKSSGTTDWTAPAGQTVREESIGTGGGRITALVTDSGGPVATGNQGGLAATADSTNGKATMWSFLLRPSN
jgi:PKD repeat protein